MNVNDITEMLNRLNNSLPEYKGTLHFKVFKDGSCGVHMGKRLMDLGLRLPDWLYHCDDLSIEGCINNIKEYLEENKV